MKPCLLRCAAGVFAALVLCVPWAGADQYPRQLGIDVQHYVFRITLADDTDEIAGETTVDLRFVKDGVTEFSLDLATPAGGKGMTVTAVTSGDRPMKYSHQSDRLTVTLTSAPVAGERRQFMVTYHGIAADGLRIGANRYGERTFFSANWPDKARQWLPMIDHPYDKATSEFIITAPSKYQVVANGLLQEEIDLGDGRRITHWKQSVPIASWLNNIGVAQFATRYFGQAAGVPLQTWVFHQDRDAGIGTFEEPTRESMEFYSDRIGPYPYGKLADVQAAGMSGGMEHASAIFFGERSVTGSPALGLVSHEIAHQWFGDSVTEKDWDDVWLSEGFATYFSLLTAEHYQGHDAFVAALERARAGIFKTEKRLPGMAVVQDKPWTGIPNGIVYQKGGWTLHMLRGQVGDRKFWEGIREYYRRYRDGSASTADFRKVMEETSGQDLGWFFQQWLYRAGTPVIEGGWKYNPGTKRIEVDLAQTTPDSPYRLPIEVGITDSGTAETRVEKIEFTGKQQKFQIAADHEPSQVVLDPNTWVLMETKFTKR